MEHFELRNNVWTRVSKEKGTNDYLFHQAMNSILKEKYDGKDFTHGRCSEDDTEGYCICGKEINNLYFIKHIKTGVEFQVGSKCIEKLDYNLHKKMTAVECQYCGKEICNKSALKKHYESKFCMRAQAQMPYKLLCKEILNIKDNGFARSVYNQLGNNKLLSHNQINILYKIHGETVKA